MLSFVPRKVAKALKSQKNVASTSGTPASTEDSRKTSGAVIPLAHQALPPDLNTSDERHEVKGSGQHEWKGKGRELPGVAGLLYDEDYVALLRLTVSEHALWSNPDLRRNLEHSDDGFVPLTYLIDTSSYLSSQVSEAILVKAIRAHGNEIFDVRLLMSSPSRSEWYGSGTSSKRPTGGYEIRLKDWEETLQRSRQGARNEWESRTLYMENIPPQHRSFAGIFHLISGLLPSSPSNQLHAQAVSLPKHYLDKLGDLPKCKGFALVTLLRDEDIDFLLQRWPWKRVHGSPNGEETNLLVQEATKFGFRTLSKSRWDALNSEYRLYQQRILDEIAEHERSQARPPVATTADPEEEEGTETVQEEPSSVSLTLDYNAPYPPGCLVHVRHVHPETNKTTLRKLFAKASSEDDVGIDYVDFNKGMITCYLRLATPKHTERLVTYFQASPVVQASGLDDTGSSSSAGGEAITVEIVEGTREELYWLKVPEKLRRQAVEKAILGSQSPSGTATKRKPTDDSDIPEGHKPRRRRKR